MKSWLLNKRRKERIFFTKKKEKKQNHSQTSVSKTFLIPKNNVTAANFQVAHCIVRHGKPLSEGEFVKQAFLECSITLFAGFQKKDLIIKCINN